MKNFYFLLLSLLSISSFAQNKEAFTKFDTSGMQTQILTQNALTEDITNYNHKKVNHLHFYQAYKTIAQGDLQERLLPLQNLKEQSKQSYFTKVIPLAILHTEFESVTDTAFQNNKVTVDAQGYILRADTETPIFEKSSLTIAAPLRKKTKGLQTTFRLDASNVFNTTNNSIDKITADFNDGEGFRVINTNQNITVLYTEEGKKTIHFNITLNTGEIVSRTSTIEIKYSNQDLSNLFNREVATFTSSITPNLSAYGETTSYPGVGEYEIFLSDDNVLDKPIFLVDGFDPGDGRDITGLQELLNFDDNGTTSNLETLVKEEDFDVVYLNFPVYTRATDNQVIDGGSDFIERNAMLLVELINLINMQKVGSAQNVVIGPSMGGLISRYALNYMENANINHETRLWISFDAPHHGANVPIGFQHQFNFLAFGLDDFWILGDQNVEELQPIIDGMLTSAAARQMLTDQFEPHITNSDGVSFNNSLATPRAHPFKNTFFNSMNSLTTSGFPELTRNVSIINGSGNNSRYPDNTTNMNNLVPGSKILDADIDVMTGADMKIETHFTPYAGTQIQTSKVHLDFSWWFPLANDRHNNANSTAFTYTNGIDAASGGLFDILKLTDDLATDGLVGDFLGALNTDYFNFIPSVSAMAFEITNNEINWFHTPSSVTTGRSTTNTTPFDAWYMPTLNEPHVTLTQENVAFALYEIFQETLSTDVTLQNNIKLEQNPISNGLNIVSTQTYENTKITIVDVTGKMVYNTQITLNERTNIPLQIASGLYILNIETTENKNLKTKFVVR
ncbi:T9SS type A sorting domain-containing protein [Lacinutrix sp. C3R15]|uniref:T9SS type A sorting domain-containing protein n=1 Tax=Flavobacteriaceae TaxID=49546 RepID=UPI001C091F85|nr:MULTISPECIES: T9SS type A sorting domain-containing protein [Flavobacteriaceae]MBU2939265.1 T9SS type A sorting domain-containing protein [Lacinutrix sp. C3R15]MDO6622580.1 T9SS type A sorting domain-containing protein [Oceanihabitans sp. 1_MG-2023]